MMGIERLVRQEVITLEGYKEGGISCSIKLDANENGWGIPPEVRKAIKREMGDFPYHRYPDPESIRLRDSLSSYTGVDSRNILVANGSDELIQYLIHTFVDRGDRVVIPFPTFSMYGFCTRLAGGVAAEVSADGNFDIHAEDITKAAHREQAKVVFLCNPNNPTGKVLPPGQIKRVIEETPGIVVVDEAYYEFYGQTVMDWVNTYPNLVVMRTFSKAMAIGGLRVGYLAAGDEVMEYLERVKMPYNVSSFSQWVACRVLEELDAVKEWLEVFKGVRRDFVRRLGEVKGVEQFPTESNFVFLRVDDAGKVWSGLVERGILVRKFGDARLEKCLRVTIATPGENDIFLEQLSRCVGEGWQ